MSLRARRTTPNQPKYRLHQIVDLNADTVTSKRKELSSLAFPQEQVHSQLLPNSVRHILATGIVVEP